MIVVLYDTRALTPLALTQNKQRNVAQRNLALQYWTLKNLIHWQDGLTGFFFGKFSLQSFRILFMQRENGVVVKYLWTSDFQQKKNIFLAKQNVGTGVVLANWNLENLPAISR